MSNGDKKQKKSVFRRMGDAVRKKQREDDLEILWPQLVKASINIGQARTAFFLHCTTNDHWTNDYTYDELADFVGELEPESRIDIEDA